MKHDDSDTYRNGRYANCDVISFTSTDDDRCSIDDDWPLVDNSGNRTLAAGIGHPESVYSSEGIRPLKPE